MAFLLSRPFEQQLQVKSRLTDDSFNPSNLENFVLPPGITLPTDWLGFTEQTADELVDQMTQEAEKRALGVRTVDAAIDVLRVDNQLVKQMAQLVELAAKNESQREELFGKYQVLKQQLETTRLRAGLDVSFGVESANVGLAGYRRGLQEKLRKITNLAAGGTHQGALSLSGSGAASQTPIQLVS